MEDNQELTHLDALFRQAFEDLPDTPSPSGWDTPSPRVWEGVRTHLQASPRAGGWSLTAWLLAGAAFVALLAGLYWAFLRPSPLPETPSTASVRRDDTPTERMETAPAPEVVVPSEQTAPSAPARTPQIRKNAPNADHRAEPLLPSSAPLPGSAPAPNTTIWREVQALQQARWAQPLQPLPPARMDAHQRAYPPDIRNLLPPSSHKPE